MSIKLRLASIWVPQYIKIHELDRLALKTINGLNDLLGHHEEFSPKKFKKKDIEGRRAEMAAIHNEKVKKLIDKYGYPKAIEIGRKSMYNAGFDLGVETRHRLGIGNSLKDLELAAKILYKILGIEFRLENRDEKLYLIVGYCDLANYYDCDTCKVLSAADEGVIHGLWPGASMKFIERITENKPECMALIRTES
ncbi:MAG: hypothetical protein ACP5C3_03110 [Methanomicrobiales archaeon]